MEPTEKEKTISMRALFRAFCECQEECVDPDDEEHGVLSRMERTLMIEIERWNADVRQS